MIRADMIPDEVVEAAVKAFDASEEDAYVSHAHDIRASIAAALNAWPGMRVKAVLLADTVLLPLPQESNNAEA